MNRIREILLKRQNRDLDDYTTLRCLKRRLKKPIKSLIKLKNIAGVIKSVKKRRDGKI